MIAWISKMQEEDFVGVITAMNGMIETYTRDNPFFSRATGRRGAMNTGAFKLI